MAGVEVRGSVVRPVRLATDATGSRHICASVTREIEFRSDAFDVRIYFEEAEFTNATNNYLLIVAGDAPRVLRIETPHFWHISPGGATTLEVLQFCRRG